MLKVTMNSFLKSNFAFNARCFYHLPEIYPFSILVGIIDSLILSASKIEFWIINFLVN